MKPRETKSSMTTKCFLLPESRSVPLNLKLFIPGYRHYSRRSPCIDNKYNFISPYYPNLRLNTRWPWLNYVRSLLDLYEEQYRAIQYK
jgi:hypothetical protein